MFWTKKRQKFEADERAKDREMFLAAIREMGSIVERTMEASAEQARVMRAFLDAYSVSEAPSSRTLRDIDEFRMELERMEES